MDNRVIIAAIYFIILAGVLMLIVTIEEPSRILDWIGGTLLSWGTLIIQFYFRKKGTPNGAK